VFRAEARLHSRGWCSAVGAAGVFPLPGQVVS